VDEQIAALEAEYNANEAREGGLLGGKTPWIPEDSGSLAQRQAKLQRQQEQLKKALAAIVRRREEVVAGPAPRAIASVTDPDSRVMRDKEGRRKPNYNGQLATDTAQGMILATEVNDAAEDSGQASVMLSKVQENLGQLPTMVSADSQYNTGPELQKLETMGVVTYMPDNGQPSASPRGNDAQTAALAAAHAGEALSDAQWAALPKEGGRVSKAAFRYDEGRDQYRCPMGQVLPFVTTNAKQTKGGQLLRRRYGGCPACAQCPRASLCCQNPRRGRTVYRDQYEECRERLRARMRSEEGRARYKLRGQTVEPRFGLIKYGLGIRRFLRRGLAAVRVEWEVVATAVNVGILLRHWDQVRAVL